MTLDATPAGAASDSYVTVADADDFLELEGLGRTADTWRRTPLEQKERALRRATHECDRYKRAVGTRYADGQRLLFPRLGDYDLGGFPVVPEAVKRATIHQALYVLENQDSLDNAASMRAKGLISFQSDDGSGSMIGVDPQWGRMSPEAMAYLDAVPATRRGLRSVVIGRPWT